MVVRKFFFDLVYVRGDMVARHPDFFYLYDEYYIKPKSLEKIISMDKNYILAESREYYVDDGTLFVLPWGDAEREVQKIIESDAWDIMKNAGRVYYVSLEPDSRTYVVHYIEKGSIIYPVRVEGNLVTLYLPDGYVSTDVYDFSLVKSIEEVTSLRKIYNYSFVEGNHVKELIGPVCRVRGAKITVYPGFAFIWKGAYTVRIDRDGAKMLEPFKAEVDDPVLSVLLPYHAYLIM